MTAPSPSFSPRHGPQPDAGPWAPLGHVHDTLNLPMDWKGEVADGYFRHFDFADGVLPGEFVPTPVGDTSVVTGLSANPEGTTTAMNIWRSPNGTSYVRLQYDFPYGGAISFWQHWYAYENPNSDGDDAIFNIDGSRYLTLDHDDPAVNTWVQRNYALGPGIHTFDWGFYQTQTFSGSGTAGHHWVTDLRITKATGTYNAGAVVRQGSKLWVALYDGVSSAAGTFGDWDIVGYTSQNTVGATLPTTSTRFEGDLHYLTGTGLHMLVGGAWTPV